eukprot:CAMPEP_0176491514 /NCGR_PEP_ID=MMETSP0200_2-20121128/8475_1 /TAXON_ID=947934 /ORGANISM="Chaetoceros sp., Strain GSL56" /LENGTH=196 /DNA_ID=CAMNT_0017888953 /DNA_START=87 /DNA_END=677 /DNA_ORIENTATION=+
MKLQTLSAFFLVAPSFAFHSSPYVKTSNSIIPRATPLFATFENHENVSNRRQVLANVIAGITLLSANAVPAFAGQPRPEYLTEPTEEFKESERQRDEFRRKQLVIKKNFNTVLDRLTFESKSEQELIADLKELRSLVIATEGLPLGIKRDELIKIIRAKKAKGFWPTNVEIAYQDLTREISYQQSPNREKDLANPL